MNRKRSSFSGKLGFVLSAAGASVGLRKHLAFPSSQQSMAGESFYSSMSFWHWTFGYTMIVAETASLAA